MGDEGDFWRDVKPGMIEASKKKRASNRENARRMLLKSGLTFQTKNNGAHLVVHGAAGIIDFWPGTGKYISRDGIHKGRGLRHVLKLCKE
jgi:hypothetical protein